MSRERRKRRDKRRRYLSWLFGKPITFREMAVVDAFCDEQDRWWRLTDSLASGALGVPRALAFAQTADDYEFRASMYGTGWR